MLWFIFMPMIEGCRLCVTRHVCHAHVLVSRHAYVLVSLLHLLSLVRICVNACQCSQDHTLKTTHMPHPATQTTCTQVKCSKRSNERGARVFGEKRLRRARGVANTRGEQRHHKRGKKRAQHAPSFPTTPTLCVNGHRHRHRHRLTWS